MEQALTREQALSLAPATPFLIDFPASRYWVDYDRDADVLYIGFARPQQATDTDATDDGLLLRYRERELVGITVLDASKRVPTSPRSAGDTGE